MSPEQAFAKRWRKYAISALIGFCVSILVAAALLILIFGGSFCAAVILGFFFGLPILLTLPQQRVRIASSEPTTAEIVAVETERAKRFYRAFRYLFLSAVALVLVATASLGGREGAIVAGGASVVVIPLIALFWRQGRQRGPAA